MGYSVDQINGSLKATLNLASASGEDLGAVADIVSDSMTAFGWASDETNKFADILASTATSANTSVGAMGESFKYVAPVAAGLGMSVQETATQLGILANSGIKGSQAGTVLRSALTKLSSPTDAAEIALKKLNVATTDANGNMRNSNDIYKDLSKAMDGMGNAQQNAILKTLFGQEAMSGMAVLLKNSGKAHDDLKAKIDNSTGSAEKMAKTMNSGLGGAFANMKSATEGLAISLGTVLAPAVKMLVEGFTFLLTTGTGIIDFLNSGSLTADILTGVITTLTTAIAMNKITTSGATTALKIWGGVTKLATTMTAGLSGAMKILNLSNPLGWIAIGVGLFTVLYKRSETFRGIIQAMLTPLKSVAKWVGKIFSSKKNLEVPKITEVEGEEGADTSKGSRATRVLTNEDSPKKSATRGIEKTSSKDKSENVRATKILKTESKDENTVVEKRNQDSSKPGTESTKITEALASGTNSAKGGTTLVGEEGPELVEMPKGSRVHNAKQTSKIGSSGGVSVSISGNTFNVRQESDIQSIANQLADLIIPKLSGGVGIV